jgi:hypothetical protein
MSPKAARLLPPIAPQDKGSDRLAQMVDRCLIFFTSKLGLLVIIQLVQAGLENIKDEGTIATGSKRPTLPGDSKANAITNATIRIALSIKPVLLKRYPVILLPVLHNHLNL